MWLSSMNPALSPTSSTTTSFMISRFPLSVDKKELASLGHLELQPKSYVFYRDVRKSRDPKHDLLKLWVGDEGDLLMNFPTELQNLEKSRDELLGPLDALHGGEKGGTALDHSGRGHGNVQGDRCLTYGQSVEAQRGIGHPAGNMSQAHQREDETLVQLRDLQMVSAITLPLHFKL